MQMKQGLKGECIFYLLTRSFSIHLRYVQCNIGPSNIDCNIDCNIDYTFILIVIAVC